MKLFYNDIALHDYGQIVICGDNAVGKPESAPQWWEHRFKVRLLFKEATYADNFALVQQVRSALKTKQEGVLHWADDSGNDLINQTATIVDHDRPEQPNERGTYFQNIEITFSFIETFDPDKNSSVVATFQRTGAGTPLITLGFVEGVKYQQDVRRYSQFRSHRESATGRLEVRGRFVGDPNASLDDRRAALLAAADQMRSEITAGMDGRFKFGTIDKVVRIENFLGEYDQHINFVPFSLSATFTEFPAETGYAQAEFTVDMKDDVIAGKSILSFSGTIAAESDTHAISKLATIRNSIAPSSTWTMLRGGGGRSERISGADGDSFIRLSFDEEFEKTIANLVEWSLHLSDADDVASGMIRRTYSGHVMAVGATFDAAYNTATAKAKLLGDSKHQFRIGSSIAIDDSQFSSQRQMTGNIVVRVEFSFEYRLKAVNRVYAEINSEFSRETFGLDVETVSGTIAAADVATARALYGSIKSGYNSFMIRNERITESRQKIAAVATTGSNVSPPNAGGWGTAINVGQAADNVSEPTSLYVTNPTLLGPSYARLWTKFDFSFSIHRPKSSAAGQISVKYEISIANDYIQREKNSTVSGSAWSSSEDAGNAFLDTFLANIGLGNRISSRRSVSYEKAPPSTTATASKRKSTNADGSTFLVINFEDQFIDQLTGPSTIIKCNVRESIKSSGNRIVIQPTAASVDVLQTCGLESAKRTVAGSVTGTDEVVCFAWIAKQRALPLNDSHFVAAGDRKSMPATLSVSSESLPLQDLTMRTGEYNDVPLVGNAKFVSVEFEFVEVLEQLAFL